MAAKRGTRSKPVPEAAGHKSLLVDAVVVFGIVVSLGLVAVSVALNFRMAYRSADTPLDGSLYGAGAAFGDCLKAVGPFMASWGLKHRDMLAVGCAVVLFGICTGYSFVSALGFAAEHRANKAAAAQGQIDAYGDLRGEKKRLEERLAFLGQQRSVPEVEAEVSALLRQRLWAGGQPVGVLSEDCRVDRKATRAVCERVMMLKSELARATERASLSIALRDVLSKLAMREKGAGVSSADAQADALFNVLALVIGGVGREQVGIWLSFLLACFIETGSGVGLFMVTTPWRAPRTAGALSQKPKSLGHVDAYMLGRIEPGSGMLPVRVLFEDYVGWCGKLKVVPYTKGEFARRFGELGEEAGLEITYRGQRAYCRNVKIVDR